MTPRVRDSERMKSLYKEVDSKLRDTEYKGKRYQLVQAMPRKVFEKKGRTLREEGLRSEEKQIALLMELK